MRSRESRPGAARKLILVVIDSLKTEVLERVIESGNAPSLEMLRAAGRYDRECVSVFPSLTPVAAATICTGLGPDEHHVPSMNWFSRGEKRYVEYGTSLAAARTFGLLRSLRDTVYNMNLEHLNPHVPTFHEVIEDAGLRAASVNFLIYRGRARHRVALEGVQRRVTDAAAFTHATYGPSELYYGELFHTRETGCAQTFALPGTRDDVTGCVGAFLERRDLYDFMVFSLPDNDNYSHRFGPDATAVSLQRADRSLARLIDAAGGRDAFLEDHAVIVLGDHSQMPIRRGISLADVLGEWNVLQPGGPSDRAGLAVSPAGRSAMIYVLDDEQHHDGVKRRVAKRLVDIDGVDQVFFLQGSEARVLSATGELAFAPGGDLLDERGAAWSAEGHRGILDLYVSAGRVASRIYPDAMRRIWSSLQCQNSGDVQAAAAPGFEFVDWGGADHVGGGSHGSLHRGDSVVPLMCVGLEGQQPAPRAWSIADVFSMVLGHFGIGPAADARPDPGP